MYSGGGGRLTVAFTGIADFKSFIGQEYISGIVKACEDYDINFINMCEAIKYSFFDDLNFVPHYLKKFRFMKKPLIDGLITWASSLAEYLPKEQITSTFSALKPLPMVDIGYLDIPGVTALRIDNSCSMQLIVEHLVRVHGYKKIAFMGCNHSSPHVDRLKSFKTALTDFKLDSESAPIFMADSLGEADIVRTCDELLHSYSLKNSQSNGERIEAIVTSSDIIASRLIIELEKRGIFVPDDVAVTGFNNQYQGISAPSPVTTINLEYFKRGYMAVELLISQIMEPNRNSEIYTVPTSLVVRESCGCFEKEILCAGREFQKEVFADNSSESEVREYLLSKINVIFAKESHERKKALVNAIFEDLYERSEISETLKWFRIYLRGERGGHFNATLCQQKITELRKCILNIVEDDKNQKNHMEDICNQLRVFCSTVSDYENTARRDTSYFNNIAQTAIHFASATSGLQMQNALKANLSELGIPGIILSLSDNMTTELEMSSVELIVPELEETERFKLPYKITNEAAFPKSFFPKNKRYSVVLQILHYNDRYFGFAFMHMRTRNMELYDSVRILLCHSLYNLYLKEGRTKEHTMLLNTQSLKGILQTDDAKIPAIEGGNLTVRSLNSYLIDHIGEKTNLDKIARDLGVSKSKLVRKTKKMTGYTVQTLHERLKMEMAKIMILERRLKLGEISERLGFQNVNYFSNVFKKNFGESPSNWAKGK